MGYKSHYINVLINIGKFNEPYQVKVVDVIYHHTIRHYFTVINEIM